MKPSIFAQQLGGGRLRVVGNVHKTDVIVIGAGHAGLAISHCLSERSIHHEVIERGEIANSWKHERWDSLKLLTPNWLCKLPGYHYEGDHPDGFMNMDEVVQFIEGYANETRAPVHTGTTVTRVTQVEDGYRVETDHGDWLCRAVVVASGACNLPNIPKVAENLPEHVQQVTPLDYRNPQSLVDGPVLVVGASASGLQLAEEIHRSGRPVTISTGEHVRMPRRYRGKDIQWWMIESGILDQDLDDIDDINRARHLPSPQLVGSNEHEILDLNAMTDQGIKVAGRLMGINNNTAQFSGSLKNVCALADLKMNRLLKHIDEWAEQQPSAELFEESHRFDATRVDENPLLTLDLSEYKTVIWATGYRPDYSWLDVPVLDRKGHIRHEGGVADCSGLYVTGLPFLRKRKSSFIHGASGDARFIVEHLANYLGQRWADYAHLKNRPKGGIKAAQPQSSTGTR